MKTILYMAYYSVIALWLEPDLVDHSNVDLLSKFIPEVKQFLKFSYVLVCYFYLVEGSLLVDDRGGFFKELLRPFKILIGYYLFRRVYLIIHS